MTNNLTMQELLDQQDQVLNQIKVGQTITGKVIKINAEEITLDLNFGFDGVVPASELNIKKNQHVDEIYKVGDEITGQITKVYQKDGKIVISKLALDRKTDMSEIEKAFEEKRIITVNVVKNIERGVFAAYKTQELFIPISQIDTKFVQDTSKYVGRNLEIYIREFDAKKNRMVGSHRDVLQERLDKERAERRERIKAEKEAERIRARDERNAEKARIKQEKTDLFNSLETGQKLEGKVTKLMPYGAFVDIGGIEGLVHLNNLSWKRVETVEEMLQEGQEVEVYVLDANKETNKLALALKDINNDPWKLIAEEVNIDDIITGKVVRMIEKGAFLEIREGVEAYLPISELSDERVSRMTNVVNIGDEVKVKVLNFKPKDKRMLVSIKEVNREPEEDISEYLEVEESLGSLGDLFKDKFKDLKL